MNTQENELKSSHLKQNYWENTNSDTLQAAKNAMTLGDQQIEGDDFQLYGDRLCKRIINLYEIYSNKKIEVSSVLEIGCGMGRYALPFSKQSKFYYGEDISEEMIKACINYLNNHNLNNYEIKHNNGLQLQTTQKLDFIFSTGVFQHIVLFDVIVNYIKQSMQLLNDNGIFIFQFMGFYTNTSGSGKCGAQIKAKDLNKYLKSEDTIKYKIKEINIDPHDPMKQIFIVLENTNGNENERDFELFKMTERNFRTEGIFDDLKSYQSHRDLWSKNAIREINKLTFYT